MVFVRIDHAKVNTASHHKRLLPEPGGKWANRRYGYSIGLLKSSDKVPQSLLLCKLKFYGIEDNVVRWVSAFLNNQIQEVLV